MSKKINVFDIISRVAEDFGNNVFCARSFPSVDVKFDGTDKTRKVCIHTYDSYEPEFEQYFLEIEWKYDEPRPVYSIRSHIEQTTDGQAEKSDEYEYETDSIDKVVIEILNATIIEDEPNHDDYPEFWESGMFPDEYQKYCLTNRKGIFEGITDDTVLTVPWF